LAKGKKKKGGAKRKERGELCGTKKKACLWVRRRKKGKGTPLNKKLKKAAAK